VESQHLLSNGEYQYITSQKRDDFPNPSELRKRIKLKVSQAFGTFDMILTSEILAEDEKSKFFEFDEIHRFLDNWSTWDWENLPSEENFKQSIVIGMIRRGLYYFQHRCNEVVFLKKEIERIEEFLISIDYFAKGQETETEAMQMYYARRKMKRPPQLTPMKDYWMAECMACYSYSAGNNKTEKDAIREIRHSKHCLYVQDIKNRKGKDRSMEDWRYIRTIPPRDK